MIEVHSQIFSREDPRGGIWGFSRQPQPPPEEETTWLTLKNESTHEHPCKNIIVEETIPVASTEKIVNHTQRRRESCHESNLRFRVSPSY